MKLFLHTCCAPCAIFPLESAKLDGFTSVTAYFYNPNIHPREEYIRRLDAAKKYFGLAGTTVIDAGYEPAEYFLALREFEDRPKRCYDCWSIRLGQTVRSAAQGGFDAFTTTLLESPYQDHDMINTICQKLTSETGVGFYYKDFRTGFKSAHDRAREMGIYCQRYCGCVFSIIEREMDRKNKRVKV